MVRKDPDLLRKCKNDGNSQTVNLDLQRTFKKFLGDPKNLEEWIGDTDVQIERESFFKGIKNGNASEKIEIEFESDYGCFSMVEVKVNDNSLRFYYAKGVGSEKDPWFGELHYEIKANSYDFKEKLSKIVDSLCEDRPPVKKLIFEENKEFKYEEIGSLTRKPKSKPLQDNVKYKTIETGERGCINCDGEKFNYDCEKCLEEYDGKIREDDLTTPFWDSEKESKIKEKILNE